MSKTHKTSFKAYSAWNYQREIEDLNKKSEQGWQLIKGGCFHSKFIYNPAIRYRYQVDFRKVDDLGRYIETFREQGWEYVSSTYNDWHFFRKLYDPYLPDSAYEIFTDRQSLEEMNRRWARIALGLIGVIGVIGLIDIVRWIARPQLPVMIQTATLIIEALILLRGVFIMRDADASRNRRGDSALFAAILAVLIIGSASSVALAAQRPHLSGQMKNDWRGEAAVCQWLTFDVSYTDRYYLDLTFDAEKEITVELVDETGNVVFTEVGTHADLKDMPLKLKRGSYEIILQYDSEHKVDISIQ